MERIRRLEGRGELSYDYGYDNLFFRMKGRDYKESIEIDNMLIDIDSKNFIVGFQIFEASNVTNVSKIHLRGVKHGKFNAKLSKDGRVEVKLVFQIKVRNKIFNNSLFTNQDFKRVKTPSQVKCSA